MKFLKVLYVFALISFITNTAHSANIETVDVSPSELAGFRIAQDWDSVKLLSEMKLGKAFGNLSKKAINSNAPFDNKE